MRPFFFLFSPFSSSLFPSWPSSEFVGIPMVIAIENQSGLEAFAAESFFFFPFPFSPPFLLCFFFLSFFLGYISGSFFFLSLLPYLLQRRTCGIRSGKLTISGL